MPNGGVVDLASIQVAYLSRNWCVILNFTDSQGRKHRKIYKAAQFLEAMSYFDRLNSTERLQVGRTKLGIRPKAQGRGGAILYHLRLEQGKLAILGPQGSRALHDLSLMLHMPNTRGQLLAVLRDPEEFTLLNPHH